MGEKKWGADIVLGTNNVSPIMTQKIFGLKKYLVSANLYLKSWSSTERACSDFFFVAKIVQEGIQKSWKNGDPWIRDLLFPYHFCSTKIF